MTEQIKLGSVVRDRISGFTGVAVSRTSWLHGCIRIAVSPQKLDKDGKRIDSYVYDEPQLEVISASESVTEKSDSPEIKLGSEVRDRISGFAGVVTSRTTFLHSCARISVSSQEVDKEGKHIDGYAFDEPQLEVTGMHESIEAEAEEVAEEVKKPHGDRPDVSREAAPTRAD